MRVITKFVADDGTEFRSAHDAEVRDAIVRRCIEIESMLGPHPEKSEDRVKHPRLEEYREAVVELCRAVFPSESVFAYPAKEIHPFSYAGRFLDEVGGPIKGLWHRLMCTGADGFEYEQPFFALNPEKFKGKTS